MQFKRPKKNINGILLLDKPLGFSSNQALQKVKWLLQAAKAGHTGTLDPLATGLLPLCFGEATKFAHYLTDADKTYIATIKLGVTTNTGDAEGMVLLTQSVQVNQGQFEQVCQRFVGEISQIPPMYSALKHEGRALYEYAREGVDIVRPPRMVKIHSIVCNAFSEDTAQITVTCSKGTYIRTLAEDIGKQLGCGAHLLGLRRTMTAHYTLEQSMTLAQIEALAPEQRMAVLLPADSAVSHFPAITLDTGQSHALQQGQVVQKSGVEGLGWVRLYTEQKVFLGLGELSSDGKIAPKRLIVKQE